MDMILKSIAELESNEVIQLSDLHMDVMHTLLAELGRDIVEKYYTIACNDPEVLGVCVLAPDGTIIGWAMGSSMPSALNKKLRQPASVFFKQMGRLAITQPIAIIHLINSIIFASKANQLKKNQVELTYIGVNSKFQGKDLGKQLLEKFIQISRDKNFEAIVLSVETDNPAAIALYKKNGFNIIQSFHEGRFERHRMELILI